MFNLAWQKGIPDEHPTTLLDFFPSPSQPPLAPDRILMLWLRFFIRKSLPFNLLESQEFRDAIAATSSLGHEVRLGGRTFMSTGLIARAKNDIMVKLRVLLLQAVPGLYVMKCLQPTCLIMPPFFISFSGSLVLDSWKSKYLNCHEFDARFTFITVGWEQLNLVCQCDAGVCCLLLFT